MKTIGTLERGNYTGPYFVVIDNEDKTRDEYEKQFGDRVVIFDKKKYADQTDEGNNFDDRRTTTHARNACFDLAERLGYRYFLVLDDDYTAFSYRTNSKEQYPRFIKMVRKLDQLFEIMLRFFENTPADCIALSQGGDFIGGGFSSSNHYVNGKIKRKVMNSFFCSTDRRFQFVSQLNEDVNTYVALGKIGYLFMTIPLASLNQAQTQSLASGMTDAYLKYGTYVKSFYTVMYNPSACKISTIGHAALRVHHQVNWISAVPQIVSQSLKKTQAG